MCASLVLNMRLFRVDSIDSVVFFQHDELFLIDIGVPAVGRNDAAQRPAGGGKSTETRLAEAERLAAVGRQVSKVAHELNDPLDGVLRYVNLSIRMLDEGRPEKGREYLERCREALGRMATIAGQLLDYSRRSHTRAEFATVEKLMEEALRTVEMKVSPPAVQIVREYGGGLPKIRSGSLYQVFCNIIKNAFDAMDGEGELVLRTSCSGGEIAAEFFDTGCGLPDGAGQSIFEPFFTTKDDQGGTGLGLAICRDIVEAYGGRIEAKNRKSKGSLFRVCLKLEGNVGLVEDERPVSG